MLYLRWAFETCRWKSKCLHVRLNVLGMSAKPLLSQQLGDHLNPYSRLKLGTQLMGLYTQNRGLASAPINLGYCYNSVEIIRFVGTLSTVLQIRLTGLLSQGLIYPSIGGSLAGRQLPTLSSCLVSKLYPAATASNSGSFPELTPSYSAYQRYR